MTSGPGARLLALVGPVLAGALAVGGALALNDLGERERQRAQQLDQQVAALLDGPAIPRAGQPPVDPFERGLGVSPGSLPVDALPFYDEAERAAFARSRWVGDPPSGLRGPVLAPPYGVAATYEAGAVTVLWESDPATRALAADLPLDQRLAVHVYRSLGRGEPLLLAELPLSERRYRDGDLPLEAADLVYQVWAVVLGSQGRPLAAEGGDLVSLGIPERFRIALIDGDTERARIRIDVGPSGLDVSSTVVHVGPGEALVAEGRSTGLVLSSLEQVSGEQLQTRRRMAFRSDGSLVLDPDTQTPRSFETQVLVSVTRLVATLSDSSGAPRTLELDIP